MKAVKRAVLKFSDAREQECLLMRVEEKAFRWLMANSGRTFDGIDYLDEPMAIKAIRVAIETDPAYVGVDLTIYAMDPTPVERAAKAILEDPSCRTRMTAGYLDLHEVTAIIERETNLTAFLEASEVMFAYLFTRNAYRDMALSGLMWQYLIEIEKVKRVDLSKMKEAIGDPKVERLVVTASKMPDPPKGIVQ